MNHSNLHPSRDVTFCDLLRQWIKYLRCVRNESRNISAASMNHSSLHRSRPVKTVAIQTGDQFANAQGHIISGWEYSLRNSRTGSQFANSQEWECAFADSRTSWELAKGATSSRIHKGIFHPCRNAPFRIRERATSSRIPIIRCVIACLNALYSFGSFVSPWVPPHPPERSLKHSHFLDPIVQNTPKWAEQHFHKTTISRKSVYETKSPLFTQLRSHIVDAAPKWASL